ncbi:MAG: cytochrome c3 family protein, partial [Ignavibacteria bacterium]|nr:cytochrome c3 family protein [Ignavibacteria bacterium]
MFLKKFWLFAAIFLLLGGVNFLSAQQFNCLDCHENVIRKSVHNEVIDCQSCHQDIVDESHADNKDKIKKVQCQSCHDDKVQSMQND